MADQPNKPAEQPDRLTWGDVEDFQEQPTNAMADKILANLGQLLSLSRHIRERILLDAVYHGSPHFFDANGQLANQKFWHIPHFYFGHNMLEMVPKLRQEREENVRIAMDMLAVQKLQKPRLAQDAAERDEVIDALLGEYTIPDQHLKGLKSIFEPFFAPVITEATPHLRPMLASLSGNNDMERRLGIENAIKAELSNIAQRLRAETFLEEPGLRHMHAVPMAMIAEYVPKNLPQLQVDMPAMVSRQLVSKRLPPTKENIANILKKHEELISRYFLQPVFGQRTIIFAEHEIYQNIHPELDGQHRFGRDDLMAGIQQFSLQVERFRPNFPGKMGLESEGRVFLVALEKAAERPMTVVMDGHGLGASAMGISPIALAESYAGRHKNLRNTLGNIKTEPDVFLMASCFSADFVQQFLRELADLGAPIPIVITESERGQLSWGEGKALGGNIIYQHLLHDASKPPTIGRMIGINEHNKNSNPTVMLPSLPSLLDIRSVPQQAL